MGRRRQGELEVAAAVMVVVDRRVAVRVRHIDDRPVADGCGFGLIMVVVMVVINRRSVGIGDARKLQGVLDAVLRRDRRMRLQRDHDGHAEADAEKAKQFRQRRVPDKPR